MQAKKLSSAIIFNNILVNAIDTNSGIFVGTNNQWYWNTGEKINEGFGTVRGKENLFCYTLSIVIDPDLIDSPMVTT
jgi:hypothetical protein